MKMLAKETNKEMQDILANHLFVAIQLDEHVNTAHQWLRQKKITISENSEDASTEPKQKVIFSLSETDQQNLLLSLCKSSALPLVERNNLVEQVFSHDKSSSAIENTY